MRASQLYLATLKESPAEAEIMSHQLMIRGGFIRKTAAGIYSWLPLGVRVLRKVENIVREEMNNVGGQECLMPMIQPGELWEETGRWQQYGPELLRFQDRHHRHFCLGPTHEEIITDLIRKEVRSYKQLPLILYQIQTKFRDEIRPRFGVMRGREFLMKDAYSFHDSQASLAETYENMYQAYLTIFKRLQLTIKVVKADTGSIGGHTSHEFQVLSEVGEDIIWYNDHSDDAINQELIEKHTEKKAKYSKTARGIEVGHIFQLGDKYSQAMQAQVAIAKGDFKTLEMGCYGIGISRIVAAAIEQCHVSGKLRLPLAIAPFQVAIIPIGYSKHVTVKEASDKLYNALQLQGIEVLLDDRAVRFGLSLADMDLIGVSKRIIVSETGLSRSEFEYKDNDEPSRWLSQEALSKLLNEILF